MMRQLLTILLFGTSLVACGDDPVDVDDECNASALPLSGSTAAPVVSDVVLEVQPGDIVVAATVSDPQGSLNLEDVIQTIGVFPDDLCEGTAIEIQDDIVASGFEETFGTVVTALGDPILYGEIAAAASWPVEVDFADRDGNRTTGRVRARVIE